MHSAHEGLEGLHATLHVTDRLHTDDLHILLAGYLLLALGALPRSCLRIPLGHLLQHRLFDSEVAHVLVSGAQRPEEPGRCLVNTMISESISLAAYHHHLLETLRIHSSKLERTRPASASPDDPEDVARQNSQDLFGIVFLMIIRFYSLDEQTMQSLSSGTASQIQAKLTSLLEALDGSANVDLNGSQKDNPRKQGFIPIGPYRRLEEALNCLSLSKAQVPIAASTSRSLFQFQSDGDISEAQRLALDLTTALMDSEKLCRASCGAEIVPTVTRLDGNTGRNILSRLESSFRTPISKMLDMIQAGFSNCLDHSPDRHHQILLRLLDAQGLVGTEDDLIFDLLLFCPSPNQWQHTCCNWLT